MRWSFGSAIVLLLALMQIGGALSRLKPDIFYFEKAYDMRREAARASSAATREEFLRLAEEYEVMGVRAREAAGLPSYTKHK